MSAPGTAAELTALADHIDDRLRDEYADRQYICEQAERSLRDFASRMPGHVPVPAELAARRTAAAAVLADFRADLPSAPLTSPPPMASWALRLASALGDVLDGQDDAVEDLDDGTEPYCTVCREWAGMFHGLKGWRHFRGDWAPGGVRTLYEAADHEPVIGWTVPPGRGLSPAGLDTLRQALADAAGYRARYGVCADCDGAAGGPCRDHYEDDARVNSYLALAAVLGIEVER